MSLPAIVTIVLISLIMNWGVQLGYYMYATRRNPQAFKGHKTLLQYYTGYIGDGIILPLMNVLIYFVLIHTVFPPPLSFVFASLVVGIVADFFNHYIQARSGLTNWSMPKAYQWNFAGHWHMISFPFQIGYICLFFLTVFSSLPLIFSDTSLVLALSGVVFLIVIFLLLFKVDYS